MILDLSSPARYSMKDGIPKFPYPVQYVTVDDLIVGVTSRGRGALMAKFDVASAYQNVGVYPEECCLLGMKWRDSYYVDLVPLFGL